MNESPNADERFVSYYAEESASPRTRERFESVRRIILRLRARLELSTEHLDVLDVGCGAGTQSLLWARHGHRATGIDISAPLVAIATERAHQVGQRAEFVVGSATSLPLADNRFDAVLVSELLEHLPEWEPCINEALRVLRPGGVIYFSTTNRLCPVQQEFDLPFYSWYPTRLKRHCEKLAVTTHGHWVQHVTFPAVHWFSFYQLRDYLDERGVSANDRFDIMEHGGFMRARILAAIRRLPVLRFVGHVLTPYTVVAGFKRESERRPPSG